MKAFFICFLLLIPLGSLCQRSTAAGAFEKTSPNSKYDSLTYLIIPANGTQFGYDIFQNNKLLIHQPTVPGVAGQNGFKKKDDAEKVAQLVISKIKNNIFPPTISLKEMEDLKINLEGVN